MDISPKKEAMTAETLAFSHSFSHVIQLTSHPFTVGLHPLSEPEKKKKKKKAIAPEPDKVKIYGEQGDFKHSNYVWLILSLNDQSVWSYEEREAC